MAVNECSNEVNYSSWEEEGASYSSADSDAASEPQSPPVAQAESSASTTAPQAEEPAKTRTKDSFDVYTLPPAIDEVFGTVRRFGATIWEKPAENPDIQAQVTTPAPQPEAVEETLLKSAYDFLSIKFNAEIYLEASLKSFIVTPPDFRAIEVNSGKYPILGSLSVEEGLAKALIGFYDNLFKIRYPYQFSDVTLEIGGDSQLQTSTPGLLKYVNWLNDALPDYCENNYQEVICDLSQLLSPYLHDNKLNLKSLAEQLSKPKDPNTEAIDFLSMVRFSDGTQPQNASDLIAEGSIEIDKLELLPQKITYNNVSFEIVEGSQLQGIISLKDSQAELNLSKLELKLKNIQIDDINIPHLEIKNLYQDSIKLSFDVKTQQLHATLDLSVFAEGINREPFELRLNTTWIIGKDGIYPIPDKHFLQIKAKNAEGIKGKNLKLSVVGLDPKDASEQNKVFPHYQPVSISGGMDLVDKDCKISVNPIIDLPLSKDKTRYDFGSMKPRELLSTLSVQGEVDCTGTENDFQGNFLLPKLETSGDQTEFSVMASVNRGLIQDKKTPILEYTLIEVRHDKKFPKHYDASITGGTLNYAGTRSKKPSAELSADLYFTDFLNHQYFVIEDPKIKLKFPKVTGLPLPNTAIQSVGVFLDVRGGILAFETSTGLIAQLGSIPYSGFIVAQTSKGKVKLAERLEGFVTRSGVCGSTNVNAALLGNFSITPSDNPNLPPPRDGRGRILSPGFFGRSYCFPLGKPFLQPSAAFQDVIRGRNTTKEGKDD